jgi:hypothetical protein
VLVGGRTVYINIMFTFDLRFRQGIQAVEMHLRFDALVSLAGSKEESLGGRDLPFAFPKVAIIVGQCG